MKKTMTFFLTFLFCVSFSLAQNYDLLYEQPYFDGGTAATSAYDPDSEVDYEVADNFSGLNEPIEEIVFYGLTLKFIEGAWQELVPGNTEPFFIRFYEFDSEVLPGLEAPSTGTYQVALQDSYGDGWNGGLLTVMVNGNAVLVDITMESGAGPDYHDFEANQGDEITTVYTPGSWADENYYAILDPDENIIAEEGGTWDNPGASVPGSIGGFTVFEPDWENPLSSEVVVADVDSVGPIWNGTYTLHKFTATLNAPVDLEEAWVSVQIDAPNGSGTWFLWLNSEEGDGVSWQRIPPDKTFTRNMVSRTSLSYNGQKDFARDQLGYDMAFELWGGELTEPPLCATNPFPAHLAENVSSNPTFSWTGSAVATGYLISIGDGINPLNPFNIEFRTDLGNVTSYTLELPLEYNTGYQWRVIPYNTAGEATGCPLWTFETMDDPTITELPWFEGFEDDFPPPGWTNLNWVQSLFGSPHTGEEFAYSNTAGSELTTPAIVLPEEGQYELSFWYRAESVNYPQDMDVLLSTDGQNFDVTVLEVRDLTSTTYQKHTFLLHDLSGETIHVKFVGLTGTGGFDWGILVDDVSIQETPEAPVFVVDPGEKDFGIVGVDEFSPVQTFTISNIGAGILEVMAPGLDNQTDFILSYEEEDFPALLSVNETVTFGVVFNPQEIGPLFGEVTIAYDDGEEQTEVIALSGEGFVRPAGSTCDNPYFITELPLVDFEGDTEPMGDDYTSSWITPVSSYINGNDMVFSFTLDEPGLLSGSMSSPNNWIGLFILEDCPDPVEPAQVLQAATSSGSLVDFENLPLPAGDYFAIVSSWPSPQTITFTLNLSVVNAYEVTFVVVEDTMDQDPVEDALISINATDPVHTNEEGIAAFFLTNGSYSANITRAGYESQTIDFTVDGQPKTINVALEVLPLLFYQAYYDGGTAATSALDPASEIDFEVADNFFGVDNTIEEFVFYGLAMKFIEGVGWQEQTPADTEPFIVRFYEYQEEVLEGLMAPQTGTYQLALQDDFDHWNWGGGSFVSVFVNGVMVIEDAIMLSGDPNPKYYTFEANEGDEITTVYTPGGWADENYYAIIDPDDNIIAEEGGTWDNPGASVPGSIGGYTVFEPDWANPLETQNLDADVELVGPIWNGARTLYKFSVTLDTGIEMEEGWISAQIDAGNGSGTWFLWLNSLDGDLIAWHRVPETKGQAGRNNSHSASLSMDGTSSFSRGPLDYDLALELYGSTEEIPAELTLNFGEGFTWFSVNVDPGSMAVNNLFAELAPCDGDRILGQGPFAFYNELQDLWFGTLTTIEPAAKYVLDICSEQQMTLSGAPVPHAPISLGTGFTWLGYLPQACLPTNTALADIQPAPVAGDRIISQVGGFAVYNADQNTWLGTLVQMCPGVGYVIEMNNPTVLNYPEADAKSALAVHPGEKPKSPTGVYPKSNLRYVMTLLGNLYTEEGMISLNPKDVVYAFVDGECRGMERPMPEHEGAIFMTIGSNMEAGEQVYFKVWLDELQGFVEIRETLTYQSLGAAGTLADPFPLTVGALPTGIPTPDMGAFFVGEPFPNPFREVSYLPFRLDEPSHVKLSIFNMQGQLAITIMDRPFEAGNHQVEIKRSDLLPGVYFFRMEVSQHSASRQKTGRLIIR